MKLKGLLCIILLILQSGAFGTEHCEANKVLSVTASKPEGLKNFTSFPFENDFYFVGEREREGAINFKVSLSVQKPDLTLKAPETNPVTKSTNGGVITEYEVVKTAGGEKKISGKVYLVVLSAEICETFKVDDDVVIGVSKGKSENPKTKLMAEAVGADDWTATIKLIPDDKSVEILEPTELSKSSNLTNIRITKGYEFEKKETKELELSFKIKGKEVKVVKDLDLLPVEIKVNDTIKEEDDFVAVSKDLTDEDLATDCSIKVSGVAGLTAELKVKGTDGDIKFKDQTLTLTSDVEAKTKMWGISTSSAENKTIIEITLKKNGREIGKIEEDVTNFEGVEVRYEGKTYSNIDTREFGRRPWDGRKDPKPNSKYDPIIKPKAPGFGGLTPYVVGMQGMEELAAIAESAKFNFHSHDYRNHETLIPDIAKYRAAVGADEVYGYASAFSFKLKDNKGITSYRPWTDTSLISVKVVGLFTIKPRVEVKDDPLLEKTLSLEDGSLSNVGNNDEFVSDAAEIFRNPIMHIDGELSIKSSGKKTDTAIKFGTELAVGNRFSDISDPKFDLDIAGLNSDLSNYINDTSKPQAQRDLAKILKANPLTIDKTGIFSWKNDAMKFEKNANSKSIFTKHIVHQVDSKTATYRNRLTWAGLHEASGTSLIIDGKIIKQP